MEDEDDEGMTVTTTIGVFLIWLAILIPLWLMAFSMVFYVYEAYATRQPEQSSIQLVPEPKPASPNGARG